MTQCPSCLTPAAAGDRFCNQCGARLVDADPAIAGGQTQRSLSLADVQFNLGLVYFKKQEFRKALETWERGLRQDPGNPFLQERVDAVRRLLEAGGAS